MQLHTFSHANCARNVEPVQVISAEGRYVIITFIPQLLYQTIGATTRKCEFLVCIVLIVSSLMWKLRLEGDPWFTRLPEISKIIKHSSKNHSFGTQTISGASGRSFYQLRFTCLQGCFVINVVKSQLLPQICYRHVCFCKGNPDTKQRHGEKHQPFPRRHTCSYSKSENDSS